MCPTCNIAFAETIWYFAYTIFQQKLWNKLISPQEHYLYAHIIQMA